MHLSLLPSRFPLLNKLSTEKFKIKSWFNKDNITISLHNWLIYWLIVISFFSLLLLRYSFGSSEMFQSSSGPNNQWVISQRDDGQGLYNSGPHPHSWPQFCPPHPSSAIDHSRSQYSYGGAFTRAQHPVWRQSPNTWKVGRHDRISG